MEQNFKFMELSDGVDTTTPAERREIKRFKNVWRNIIQRCENPRDSRYRYYGQKGITVSAEWHNFSTFLQDMWPRPSPEHSIDRIDNTKGYSKENCRWATQTQQAEPNKFRELQCLYPEDSFPWMRVKS